MLVYSKLYIYYVRINLYAELYANYLREKHLPRYIAQRKLNEKIE